MKWMVYGLMLMCGVVRGMEESPLIGLPEELQVAITQKVAFDHPGVTHGWQSIARPVDEVPLLDDQFVLQDRGERALYQIIADDRVRIATWPSKRPGCGHKQKRWAIGCQFYSEITEGFGVKTVVVRTACDQYVTGCHHVMLGGEFISPDQLQLNSTVWGTYVLPIQPNEMDDVIKLGLCNPIWSFGWDRLLVLGQKKDWWISMRQHHILKNVPKKVSVAQYLALLKLVRSPLVTCVGSADWEALRTMPEVVDLFEQREHRYQWDGEDKIAHLLRLKIMQSTPVARPLKRRKKEEAVPEWGTAS